MWLGFVSLCFIAAWANAEDTIHRVVKVEVENDKQAEVLLQLQKDNQVTFWSENAPAAGTVSMFSLPDSSYESVKTKLQSEGLQPTTVIENLESAVSKEKEENKPSVLERRGLKSFDHSRYLTLAEINSFLQSISQQRSSVAEHIIIGRTYENRNIEGIKISSGGSSKPVVFLECGIHAREWVSPAACVYIIDRLTDPENTESQELLEDYDWYVIPSSNPDGYVFTWSGGMNRIWRKTRSRSTIRPSCIGADPNRNFDSNFGGVGTSRNPCEDIYCGDSPFSEKETQALRDLLVKLRPRIKYYFSLHAYSQFWMYPWGYTDKFVPNFNQLNELSRQAVEAIKKTHGKTFKYGSIPKVIYKASGSSVDWVYDSLGVKIAFALELRDTGEYGFLLPKSQIIPTGEETFAGIKAVVTAE